VRGNTLGSERVEIIVSLVTPMDETWSDGKKPKDMSARESEKRGRGDRVGVYVECR
jgi:hypothetical protein